MKILWIKSEHPLPLDTGHRKRTFNLMKHLSRIAQVTFISYTHGQENKRILQESGIVSLEVGLDRPYETRSGLGFYFRLFSQIGSSTPYFVRRNAESRIKKEQRELYRAGEVDLIVCDCLDMAAAIDYSLPVPKILLTNGLATELWHQRYETARGLARRAYFNYETKRMAEFESKAANQFDLVLTASKDERDRLEDAYRVRVPIEIVPTGVDCEFFEADSSVTKIPRKLVFTGANDMLSNIDGLLWFAAEAYPMIRRAFPEVTLDIIGPRPSSEIRALGKKDETVRVTGFVDDVRPYLAAAELFVVPLRVSGGTRTKIFEAMSMELPVVSSLFGAEGLGLIDGVHLATATSGRELGSKVIELFENQEKRHAFAEQGHQLVHLEHDWPKVARTMYASLERALNDG